MCCGCILVVCFGRLLLMSLIHLLYGVCTFVVWARSVLTENDVCVVDVFVVDVFWCVRRLQSNSGSRADQTKQGAKKVRPPASVHRWVCQTDSVSLPDRFCRFPFFGTQRVF